MHNVIAFSTDGFFGMGFRSAWSLSGSEAPMKALNELTDVYNDNLARDNIRRFFYKQLVHCDSKEVHKEICDLRLRSALPQDPRNDGCG